MWNECFFWVYSGYTMGMFLVYSGYSMGILWVYCGYTMGIQSTPDNSNLSGKSKKVQVIGSSSYQELEENSRE